MAPPAAVPAPALSPTVLPTPNLPSVPTATPTPIPTATPTPTVNPTATPTPTAVPTATPTATPVPDAIFVGAGDIARCGNPGAAATASLLDGIAGTVFTLGDNAYPSGTAADFANCYDPTWGRHKARTMPAVGNHEYMTAGAPAYYSYFGSTAGDPARGYYSYNVGAWHVVVLNSNCSAVGGCTSSSSQGQWLAADLAANRSACTLAIGHEPRFSSGQHGSSTAMQPFWQILYDAGAEIALAGHDHNYERFAPQGPAGTADPARGIRQFVVGSGGASHYGLNVRLANSEAVNTDTYGVLKLTLRATGYDWQFVPEAGRTFSDSGSGTCH